MDNRPTVEDAAKEILRIAARDLKLKANDMISAQSIIESCNNLPWRSSDLQPALVLAQKNGWITGDGRLTEAGFASAYF